MRKQWLVILALALCVSAVAEDAPLAPAHSGLEQVQLALAATPAPQAFDLRGYGELTTEDITSLVAGYPDTAFQYTVTMYGKTFPSDATTIDFGDVTFNDIAELKAGLAILPALEQADMYESTLTREQMKELDQAFPGLRFGWTLKLGNYKVRTDITAFSSLHSPRANRYSSEHYSIVKYCWQLQALDLGHNKISDLSFLESLTELRLLILADNRINDITPLAKLTKLEYVELFQNQIRDITPLANMENLLDLNVAYNRVADFSSMTTCPKLERLWIHRNKVDRAHQKELTELLPNVEICFSASESTGKGWRKHDRYFVIKDVFDHWLYRPFSNEVKN